MQYKLLNVFALFKSMETFFSVSYVCSPGNYQNIFGEDWNEGGWNPSMAIAYVCVGLQQGKGEKEEFGVKIYTHQSDSLVLSSSLSN